MIDLEHISFEYEDKCALDTIDLKIETGEKVVLLGSNGSGKSTLLRLLAGLYFANSGTYFFEKEPIKKRKVGKDFRKKVGVLFQNPESMIFNPTVYDEIAFSLKEFDFDNIEDRVVKISKEMGIEKHLKKSPLSLSGGEKQKVMLASILVYEPQLLLLDEPTAAMDPRSSGWFIDFMIDIQKTVVLATHDLSHAYEMSERAIVISEEHKKIYDGDIEVLFEDLDLLQKANLIHKHKVKKNIYNTKYHLHFKGEGHV
ncbi:energy-coupling factor ABC transporter ATP-binding protein [Sulfurospirillum sp. 1612]|uniref:energy-coupling factor ABC transporter ATP-binding protein n=1 Tax=Sulfurospirillum sp. 1612 TaxID=3094835 RepID=UPI002F91E49C